MVAQVEPVHRVDLPRQQAVLRFVEAGEIAQFAFGQFCFAVILTYSPIGEQAVGFSHPGDAQFPTLMALHAVAGMELHACQWGILHRVDSRLSSCHEEQRDGAAL